VPRRISDEAKHLAELMLEEVSLLTNTHLTEEFFEANPGVGDSTARLF